MNPPQGKWLQNLQSFLNKLLEPVVPDQAERMKYLDKTAMTFWKRAFTHETVSADHYEDLEYLGDAILKSVFPKYLMQRLPHLHKGEYTELNNAYMSKMKQAELARKMGLSEYILVTGIDKANLNLETDVFESFFGALDTISDLIMPGMGFIICYNMIIHLFKNIEIDEKLGEGSGKTQVQQMFSRFDLPKPGEQIQGEKTSNVVISIYLEPSHLEFLRSYGLNIQNATIGVGQGGTKTEAEHNAYAAALQTLENYGITSKWAKQAKTARDFADPVVAQFVPTADVRLKREGFVSMEFFIPRKTVTPRGAIVQLIGIRPNGKSELLSHTYATSRDNGYQAAKALVVQQYAQGK